MGIYPMAISQSERDKFLWDRILSFIKHIKEQGPIQLSYMGYTYEKQIFETKSDLQRSNIYKQQKILEKQKILENVPQFDNCDVSHTAVPNDNFNIFIKSKDFSPSVSNKVTTKYGSQC